MERDNDNCTREDEMTLSGEFSEKIQKSIENIINNEGYTSHTLNVRKISTGGNNFLGELYEIDIKGNSNDGHKETNIFLKRIIHNDDFKVYSIPEVYEKEMFVYNVLGEIFEELQDEANVPNEDRYKMVKSYKETNGEVIILENLSKKHFKTMPRMGVMPIEFAKLSVEQLAKFHGLSFVLQKNKKDFYGTKIETIKQSFIYDDYWNEFVRNMCLISTSKLDDVTKGKIWEFFEISLKKYPMYMNGLNSAFKCLCHGDYKMNNVLMKEKDGRIADVVPIDFQQIYFGSPVIDLIYFIYAASDRDFRKQHLNYLKDLYYITLTRFLSYFAIDVDTVFPKEEYEKCFNNSLEYALMYTLYMLPIFFVSDDVPDFSKDELLEMTIKVDDRFYGRMQGIIDDFKDLGVI